MPSELNNKLALSQIRENQKTKKSPVQQAAAARMAAAKVTAWRNSSEASAAALFARRAKEAKQSHSLTSADCCVPGEYRTTLLR